MKKPAAEKQDSIVREFLGYRRLLILASQTSLILLTYYWAFLISFNFTLHHPERQFLLMTLPLVLAIKLPLFYRFGLLSGWWRYVGMNDLLDITVAAGSSTGVLYLIARLTSLDFPAAVLIIDLLLTIVVTGGARFAVRAYTETASRSYSAHKNTLIVGAGRAGAALSRELRHNPHLDYNPIGFVDDDATKRGIKIHGIKVLGTTNDLSSLIAAHAVECVLIAIPSAKGDVIGRIISCCREAHVNFKILPSVHERVNGNGMPSVASQVRAVRLEDLLGRDPVCLQLDSIRGRLQGKTALITGAGGSIGSELVRQVAQFSPRKIVLFERSENDLFKLCNEMAENFPEVAYVPVVGDILDVGVLRDVFSLHRPQSVFHAAAYKHVPMMERNCFQAVNNNIFGTYNVALVATQFEVEDFVMISSDKAVNPTNIMGCTKRVAELIILGLQQRRTRFMAVRFGNVLGSNGSVLPIFQEQLAKGGPITVTHPEAQRYFMTIPEAVQLVLQASSMGNGGEIFVLDMGEPVRIVDLARNLIRLSGLTPDRDVQIVFTGLRPGEKLFEELQLEGEGLKPTSHEKIRVLDGGMPNFNQVRTWLDELATLVEAKNVSGLITALNHIVPEYAPSPEVLELCEFDRHDRAFRYKRQSVKLTVVGSHDTAA